MKSKLRASPPVDLYLIFEKSSCKNPVRQTGFLACINKFWNWFLQATQAVKIKSSLLNLNFQNWFFRNQVQINKGCTSVFIIPRHKTAKWDSVLGWHHFPVLLELLFIFVYKFIKKTVMYVMSKTPTFWVVDRLLLYKCKWDV